MSTDCSLVNFILIFVIPDCKTNACLYLMSFFLSLGFKIIVIQLLPNEFSVSLIQTFDMMDLNFDDDPQDLLDLNKDLSHQFVLSC